MAQRNWKDIPLADRRKFLLSLIPQIKNRKVSFFRFWINKPKMHTSVVRPFLCTCTAGTQEHPILISLIKLLLARTLLHCPLNNSDPLFGIPIHNHTSTHFTPLTYSTLLAADLARTAHLGYEHHNFRSHLRRNGGASDLYDAGIPTTQIKIIGHWSIGVLDVYIKWDPAGIARAQLEGIKRAELRLLRGWSSKLFYEAPR